MSQHSGQWSLVGVDMTGIELRMLAHFMYPYDGGEYAKLVLGGDVHQANADAWGVTRTLAKTGIYAMIYGAGDRKLGRTLDPAVPDSKAGKFGAEKRAAIMGKFPALAKLTDAVKLAAMNRGYLLGIDGRRLPVRSEHSALNTVLQSAAAVASKVWIVTAAERLTDTFGRQGWDGQWAAMAWVHDEVQVAARLQIADVVGRLLIESIEEAGRTLKFNVPITGEMKIGQTWADTH